MYDETITLSDGRKIGYAITGKPDGVPVFTFHGLPGSRMECLLFEEPAKKLGVKIISPDRPGYGLSSCQQERNLNDWPNDVVAIADSLGIDTFNVIGVSGGAPCALSCAYYIPERLENVGIVCGLGPLYKTGLLNSMQWVVSLGFLIARRSPTFLSAIYGVPVYLAAKLSPSLMMQVIALKNGKPDREVLNSSPAHEMILANIKEAFRQGVKGAVNDMNLYSRSWGFDIKSINKQITLWHGDQDKVVPLQHSQFMKKNIKNSELHIEPGEAHFSLPIRRADKLLMELLSL